MVEPEIIFSVLGGAAAAALINQIGNIVQMKLQQKQKTSDFENEKIKAIEAGMRYMLYDRIRYIGQSYIQHGNVDFDDRRMLNKMHRVYHNDLGGNGDLDVIMEAVNGLPLRQEGEQ